MRHFAVKTAEDVTITVAAGWLVVHVDASFIA